MTSEDVAFAASLVDVRLSKNDPLLVELVFFDSDAQHPHVVTFPARRLGNLLSQGHDRLLLLPPDVLRA